MKYPDLDLKTIEAVVDKLGGINNLRRLLNDEIVALDSSAMTRAFGHSFVPLCTIKPGMALSLREYEQALEHMGMMNTLTAERFLDILFHKRNRIDIEKEVELITVSAGELGFKKAAKRTQIYEEAISLGLELCPSDVGPLLRLHYTEQPMGERLLVGMDPIISCIEIGLELIFCVCCNNKEELFLDIARNGPSTVWDPSDLWVFIRPK
jgi:hypothetical protein